MARPESASDHALIDLARWARFQSDCVATPSEFSRFAIEWLGQHAPGRVERTVLCHGDAGPGNFLHAGRRVTALLDWEFAHLGDPLDDIAWVLIRSHVMGADVMRAALSTWSEQSGIPLEAGRIAYYRALVLLRMAISCEIALGNANESGAMDTATYELLLPYLGFLMPQALREAGCRDARLVALEQQAAKQVEANPVLKQFARPLVPWETPR
jgi:aminoglycoside phosphotransferase (APT) family kinase protein